MKLILKNIEIAAISSYLPKAEIDLRSLSDEYGMNEVEKIIKATGIESVRVAGDEQTSSDMCIEAVNFLCEKENLERERIDGLIFVSQTPDYILPSTSVVLQHRLGLRKDTLCLDIRYGCSGYIYGLFQAALWINSGACRNVILLVGDTSTRLINPKDRSLRMVFGDAGSATLVTKGEDVMSFAIHSDGSGADRLIVPAGGFRMPISEQTKCIRTDEDGNSRSLEDMYMDGMAIFDFAISNVHTNIQEVLDLNNWDKNDVDLYALHQANKFIVNCIRKKMKLDISKVPINLSHLGNTGPATIPVLLSDVLSSKYFSLEKVIMSGFGVGLSWGSIGCSLKNTRFYKPINK